MDDKKWEPDSEKYNQQTNPQGNRKKSLWWIPVAIVTVVIVAAVIVGAVVGVKQLKKLAKDSREQNVVEIETETSNSLIIAQADDTPRETTEVSKTSQGGVYITDVSDVVDQVMPAVVSVTSRQLVTSGGWGFFNRGNGSTKEVESGMGSGTIVGQNNSELLILTSYHVVEGASSFYLTFCDDESVEAYLKASDEQTDIAIVAAKLEDIPEATRDEIKIAVLNPDDIAVGDGVIVIGNALGYGPSVVTGIVSAKDRTFASDNKSMSVIQTDASINEGNSGGCMLDSEGKIIGISEAKISSTSVEGVCYAISIYHYYDDIMEMLEAPEAEDTDGRDGIEGSTSGGGYLGIYGRDIDAQLASAYGLTEGIYVLSTIQGGGAEDAGIRQGDIIIGMNGKSITEMTALQSELQKCEPGEEVTLTLMRYSGNGYEKTEVKVILTAAIS